MAAFARARLPQGLFDKGNPSTAGPAPAPADMGAGKSVRTVMIRIPTKPEPDPEALEFMRAAWLASPGPPHWSEGLHWAIAG
jgi:hypothetical protein